MTEETKCHINWGIVLVLCVEALMFGANKGCAVEQAGMNLRDGRSKAALVECIRAKFTPLECSNALGK